MSTAKASSGRGQSTMRDLNTILEELTQNEWEIWASYLHEGREDRQLSQSPTVISLIIALRTDPNAEEVVDRYLDKWSKKLVPNEMFEYTESTMALLYALKQSRMDLFKPLARILAASKAAEIGWLSRYARRLLREIRED